MAKKRMSEQEPDISGFEIPDNPVIPDPTTIPANKILSQKEQIIKEDEDKAKLKKQIEDEAKIKSKEDAKKAESKAAKKTPAVSKSPKKEPLNKDSLQSERLSTYISPEHYDKMEELQFVMRKNLRTKIHHNDIVEMGIDLIYKTIDKYKK
jgi:hypothetical protein